MLEHALEYLDRGWSIVPGKGKYPCVEWREYTKRLPTEDEVRTWWDQWPDANVILVCGSISGLIVVDIDTYRGGTTEGLPGTGWISRTGNGGFHYFYEYPPGEPRVGNRVGKNGIDVRGDGGIIVLPPSVHPDTRERYTWVSNEGPLGTCPKWAYERTPEVTDSEKRDEKWVADLIHKGSAPGSRNDDTARLAGYYAGKDVPLDIALASIQMWMSKQANPISPDDVEVTVRSVYRTDENNNSGVNHPFRVQTYQEFNDEFAGSSIDWLVQNWLPCDTIAFAVSEPGARKTWVSFDLAVSVASGQPFMGKYDVNETGPVLIVQQEDFNAQTAARVNLISVQKHNPDLEEGEMIPYLPDLPIHYHPDRNFRFEDKKCMTELRNVIRRIRPKLVIFDPLYAALDIDDYMMKGAKSMFPLKSMRDEFGVAFFISHHAKKTRNDGKLDRLDLWGSTFLNAFIETGYQIRKVDDETTVLGRHFKQEGAQEPVRLDWDISSHWPLKYEVKSTAISNDELRELLTGNSSSSDKPKSKKRARIPASLLEKVKKARDMGLPIEKIAEALGVDEQEVARALTEINQVKGKDPYKAT